MNKRRKRFSKEFKEEAVELVLNSDKSIQEISESLGVHPNNLSRWRKEYLDRPGKAFPGNGKRKEYEDDNFRLRKEISDLKMENEILKKSIAIFSRGK